MASLFCVVLLLQAIVLLLVPTRPLMRATASSLFIVAAASSYFCSAYGAIMSKDMMRNVIETQPAELAGLLSSRLIPYRCASGAGVARSTSVERMAHPIKGARRVHPVGAGDLSGRTIGILG